MPGDRANVSIRLFHSQAIAEAANSVVVVRRPACVLAFQIRRQPHIHVCGETKSGRKHTNYGENPALNLQVRMREVRCRSELLPPVSIADKSRGAGPFLRVLGAEISPENRLNIKDPEKTGRDMRDRRARRL